MGISKSIFEHEALTRGTAAGTPNYMSPEQARDLSGMDFRSDIYSLGVTLFRCLTGRMPFLGKSSEEIVKKHILEPAPPAKLFNKAISDQTNKLIAKMMEKDRFKRHKSWQDVINDIDKILYANSKSTPNVQKPSNKGNKLIITLVSILVVLSILLFAINRKNGNGQTEQPAEEIAFENKTKPVAKPHKGGRKPKQTKPAKPTQTEETIVEEVLEEDRLIAKIEKQLKELKSQRQFNRINNEIVTIEQIEMTKETNKQKLTLIKIKVEGWHKKALNRTFNDLKKRAEKLSANQNYSEAAILMKQYSGDWAEETRTERLQFATKYDELQRAFDKQSAIEKKFATHAMAVNLAEHITKGNFTEAEKLSKQMMEEESYFAFDLKEINTICGQLKNIKKAFTDFLTQKIGDRVIIELTDGTRQRMTIESVGESSFSGTKTIGQSSLTAKVFISQISLAQRLKMLPDFSLEAKALYQAREEIAAGNIGKARTTLGQIGTFSTFVTNHISARSSLTKIVDSVLKKSETSEKTTSRLARLQLESEPAVNLFIQLLEFKEQYPDYQRNSLYRALFTCAENNFPLELFFSGNVTEFSLQDLSIAMDYDFSDPDQEYDFEVYQPVSMGQKIEIKDNSLTIGCRRHGSLILKPYFTEMEIDFQGMFRLRDFNHIIASKEKNIAYIGHGFGKLNTQGKDGIIRNWKLKDQEEIKLPTPYLSPSINNIGHLSWDGEIVNFSINGQEWPKQIFMVDESRFAIAAFGTTNSYTQISVKGKIASSWLIKRISEIFYDE